MNKRKICEYLNHYLFDKVWNEPFKEYRRNVRPTAITGRAIRGRLRYRAIDVELPTVDRSYCAYIVPTEAFGGVIIPTYEWQPAKYFTETNHRSAIRVHGNYGQHLHRDQVFFRKTEDNDLVLMAIDRRMFIKVLGYEYPPHEVFVAMYHDSDAVGRVAIENLSVITNADKDIAAASAATATTVYINGRVASPTGFEDFQLGDIVETVTDGNVVGMFHIDLAEAHEHRRFRSDADGIYKAIVHIPKALNPTNDVITHNTCDVYVRPRNIVEAKRKGLFLSRCQGSDPAITQLTHNDFAIPEYMIDAYRGFLGANEVTLEILVRSHSKNNKLIRDRQYIEMLYLHDDKEILDWMEGTGPEDFDFWTAPRLEKSEYVKMMTDVPNHVTPANMRNYIDALGYYHTLSLIAPRVYRRMITSDLARTFRIRRPVVFRDVPMAVNLFIAGTKIHNNDVTIYQEPSNGEWYANVDPSVPMPDGGDLVVELFERFTPVYKTIIPQVDHVVLEVPIGEYTLYRIENVSPATFKGIDHSSSTRYVQEEVPGMYATMTDNTGVQRYTFNSNAYGKTFLLVGNDEYHYNSADIDAKLGSDQPIVYPLVTVPTGDPGTPVVPLLGDLTVLVYLNGRELVLGVDYDILDVEDPSANTSFRQLVVQNISYLLGENNHLEWIVTKDAWLDDTNGFVTSESINYHGEAPLWFPNLSQLCVDGYIVGQLEIGSGQLILPEIPSRLGALYGARTIIPASAREFTDEYYDYDDYEKLMRLREYFWDRADIDESTIVIPHSHYIVSIYLNQVCRDVIHYGLVLGYDPDASKMRNQVPEYQYLKALDIAYRSTTNLKYIDVFPIYTKTISPDVNHYVALMQLIRGDKPLDLITDGYDPHP